MSRVHGFVSLLLFSKFLALLLAAGDQGRCPPSFHCGYLGNFTFPFTITERQDCGFLSIRNCDDPDPHKIKFLQLPPNGKLFRVITIAQLQSGPTTYFSTLQFRDEHFYDLLQNRSCEAFRNNYTLPHISDFAVFTLVHTATLVLCNHTLHVNPPTSINMSNYKCDDYDIYYKLFMEDDNNSSFKACKEVQLPIKDLPDATDPFSFITGDVTIQVELTDQCSDCYYRQGGQCLLDSREKFSCAKSYEKTRKNMLKVVTASSVVAAVLVVLVVLVWCFRTKIFYPLFWRENPTHRIIEDILKEHGPLPTSRFSYLEVKKMTNSFRNKLGQGGFGSVYKGKLHDGRVVAVKILSISKGNGEEFINEVVSISRTSHVNIIRLLGFCFDNTHRL